MSHNSIPKKTAELFESLRKKLESFGNSPQLETKTIEITTDVRIWEFVNFITNIDQLRVQRGREKPLNPAELLGAILAEGVRTILDTQTIDLLLAQLADTPISELVGLFYKNQSLKKFYGNSLH